MKSILDKCRQIKDPESGRVLIYRDEIEAVLEVDRLLHGDTIYRRAAIGALWKNRNLTFHDSADFEGTLFDITNLPSKQPYTGEQLQKLQDLEQAQLEEAYRLGYEEGQGKIIRCKNCKHRHYLDNEPYCASTITFGWADDDFCSYAERRER